MTLEETEAIEDLEAFCTWARAISIRAQIDGRSTQLVDSRIDNTSIHGRVYADPSGSLNHRVPVDIGFGKSLWHTDGTLESATSLDDGFEIQINLERRPSTKSQEMRSETRWPACGYAPVFGEIANPFQYNRRIPFRLEDISMSGVKVVIGRPMPLLVGITLRAKINFLENGILETELLVRGVESLGNERIAHCEFVELTENHSLLISSYLNAHSKRRGNNQESLLPDVSGDFACLSERDQRVEVVLKGESVASIAVNLAEADGQTRLILDCANAASAFRKAPSALSELIGYALRCATLHRAEEIYFYSDEEAPDLVAYGFRQFKSNGAMAYSLPTTALRYPGRIGLRPWLRLVAVAEHWLPANRNPVPRTVARIAKRISAAPDRLGPGPVSWEQYAIHYDTMCSMNPAYQELQNKFASWIPSSNAERILEVGAGTGNFASLAARALPNARIVHVDRDNVMNSFAKRKYRRLGLSNIEVVESEIDALNFAPESFDAIVAVHTLYVLPNPDKVLRRLHSWLKPGGSLFIIDVGRPINVASWACYIFAASAPKLGLRKTIAEFVKGRQAVKQNQNIRQAQANGTYWTHTLSEFENALKTAGFEVAESSRCYRLMSDYALCTKRAAPARAALHNGGHDCEIDGQGEYHNQTRTEP